MKVTIYTLEHGQDKVEGQLILAGGKVVAKPEDNDLLQNILKDKVRDPKTNKRVTAESDPKAFLSSLSSNFYSPYLRASKVEGSK